VTLVGGILKRTEGYVSIDNHQIFFQEWSPDQKLIARVLLVHGLGEHSSRYGHVADFFTNAGFSITAMDLLGHGKSEGQRGHAESYEDYCNIVDYFLKDLSIRKPELPLFLYGHSMGGLIALYYVLNRKPILLKGVISSSPGLAPGFTIPQWKTSLGNLLYSLVPKFSMNNGLPISGISQDKSVIDSYNKDALNHPWITARMGMDLINNGKNLSSRASEFSLPLLLMVGSADRLVSPQAIIDFANNSSHTTTLKVWPGGFHELHNEPFKLEVLAEITGWMKKIMTNAS
jgi:acylglycerol lipase